MGNKELGIADPGYDALRIYSGQSIAPDLGGGSTGAGGIENKIYVWHADGSTIDLFDPDATGLGLALTAAASGDTVWLPSIEIDLTAGITIPAGVTLAGISWQSILSFSGFSGSAVQVSTGASIYRCAVVFDATGNDATGIEMLGNDSVADEVRITVSGASTSNIGIGSVGFGSADEVWFGANDKLYWSDDFFTTLDSVPTWNQVDAPAGTNWIGITSNGATAYAKTATNLYKTSTPKSPSWVSILALTDTINGYPVRQQGGQIVGSINLVRKVVYALAYVTIGGDYRVFYGQYDGISWAWSQCVNLGGFTTDGVGPQTYSLDQRVRDNSNALLDDMNSLGIIGAVLYRTPAGLRRYSLRKFSDVNLYVRAPGSDILSLGASSNDSEATMTQVSGSEAGEHIYVFSDGDVGVRGKLWLSNDGSAFTNFATWDVYTSNHGGVIRDALFAGGGNLVVLPAGIVGTSVPARLYERDGTPHDKTGNFWSLTSGDQFMCGMGLVY